MRETRRSIGVLVGCAVLLGAGLAFAQDWPQWRGPHRDGKVTGFTAPETWPAQLTEKWKTTVGSGDASPALVGDRLYVFTRQGDDEVILCLDADKGTEIWSNKYAAPPVTGAAAAHPGPRSSPAVAEGKVVTLGVSGIVSCVDAANGQLVWRKEPFPGVVPQFFTAMSPMIVDGMAILQVGGRGEGAIVAFDLASGEQKWQCTGEAPEYASPVLLTVDGTKQIVTLSDKSVVGVDLSNGKVLWELPFVPRRMAYNAATPIVDGQTVIYTGAGRGTTAVKLEKKGDGFTTTQLWSNPELAPQFNTPVLVDGLLFGLSDRGNLFCIDAQTGQTGWVDATSHGRGFAAIVGAGPCLFALPNTSELIVFRPDGKQLDQLAAIKVSDTATYAHPVIAGKRIFVKDEGAVKLLSVD